MAQAVGGVVGAVVGFFVGGPAGAQWGWAIGSAIGTSFTTVKQPRIGDLAEIRAGEGGPRARVYGTFRPIGGQVVWSGTPREIRTRKSGKGGPKVESSTILRSYAIGICEGPITGVSRIWRNNELVYDVRPTSEILAESAQWIQGKTLLLGGWNQLPHPTIEAEAGAGNAPAMRGTAYLVVTDEDLTDLRGAIPAYQFETSAGVTVTTDFWGYAPVDFSAITDVAYFPKTGEYLIARSAVTDTPKILSTRDGETMTPALTTTAAIVTVVTSNDWAVARPNSSEIFTSPDGTSWSSSATTSSLSYTVGLYTGSRFLFCGFGTSAEYSSGPTPSGWVSSPRPALGDAVAGVVVSDDVCVIFCINGAIHRTTNGGASWSVSSVVSDLQPSRTFICAAIDNNGLIRAYKNDASSTWVYTSTDGGQTFDCAFYVSTLGTDVKFGGGQWVATGPATSGGGEEVVVRASATGLPPFTNVAVANYPGLVGQTQRKIAVGGDSKFIIGTLQGLNGFVLSIGVPKVVGTPSDPLPLGLVIEAICSDAMLDEPKRFVDDGLNQQFLYGFATSPDYTAGAALLELAKVYFFDPQDADGVIRFIPRGGNFAAILSEDDSSTAKTSQKATPRETASASRAYCI